MDITRCCGKDQNPPLNIDHCDKVCTAVLMGQPMDEPLNSNRHPLESPEERRKHDRESRSIKTNYMVKGRWHRGSIQNISEGGAYIGTFEGRTFSPGEGIFLVARIRFLREQVKGKIAWVGPHGMGVEFQTEECV